MSNDEIKGLQTQNLPWLTRVLVHAIFDSLAEEKQALRDMGIPDIDPYIRWDEALAWMYNDKKVEVISRWLLGEDVDIYSVEYEAAYLRNREPLRVRVSKLDLNDLIVRVDKEAGEGG